MAESCSPSYMINQFLDEERSQYSIYGRIMSLHPDKGRPTELSKGRETAFLFGEDTIRAIMGYVMSDPFTVLMELGLTGDHVRWKLEVKKEKYWLVIFRVEVGSAFPVRAHPATCEGIGEILAWKYPGAFDDFTRHKHILSTQSYGYFEKESGMNFMKCLQLKKESDETSPYFSYARFLACHAPRSAWQVRLFLYCELRIVERFTGDGFTLTPDGKRGFEEFISNSFELSILPHNQQILTPLEISSDRIKAIDQ